MLSEKIESLRREICNRRLTNTDGKQFVPGKWLSDVLTEERILDSLQSLDDSVIDKDECPQVARDVWKSGLKTYAISLTIKKPDLVYRFLQTDQFDNTLDERLPMEEAKLKHTLGLTYIQNSIDQMLKNAKQRGQVLDSDPNFKKLKEQEVECIGLCQEFMSVQYMFLSPTFPQGPRRRLLEDSIRLPFVLNPEQGETAGSAAQGAFGTVSKETLPPQRYGEKKGTVIVRKELKLLGGEAYRDELRCLRLLATARHPSILELYGSYTYRMKHNFLFREAVQGDLHDLLAGKQRPPEFQHDDAFYLAFCGLASALEQVHCFANDGLKLKMIGCHHDLKPRNVLVDNGRFILADFGLATMKDQREDPMVLAKGRDMYFAAPENIDYVQGGWGQVGPPADIWSLGCMLVDVLTFMRGGHGAVHDFRRSRAFKRDFGGVIMNVKAFHNCEGGLNEATIRHLDKMEAVVLAEAEAEAKVQADHDRRQHIPEFGIIQLVREMLTIDPSTRPDIKRVLQRLRCITLQKKSEPISKELLRSPHSKSIEFIVERQVFREWLGRLGEAGGRGHLYLPSDAAFDQACATLDALLDDLCLLAADDVEFPLFAQLRRLNEQLLPCLDVAGRLDIRRAVERKAMPIARRLAKKSNLDVDAALSETDLLASGPNASIVRLLAAAQVEERMSRPGDQAVPRLKSADVTLLGPAEVAGTAMATFRLGTLKQDGGAVEIPVVVEEMPIEAKYAKPESSDRLFQRLENVLSLGTMDTLPDFRALNCRGLYFDKDREIIGLAYAYPPQVSGSSNNNSPARIVSLAQLLNEHPEPVDYRHSLVISLDDRVRLARDLALAISNFHHIGWMHKNISSHTILFFHDTPPSEAAALPHPPPRRLALSAPALIGFSHSRAKDEKVISSKRYHTSDELRPYHHPEYAVEHRQTYRAEFDYYSLGLVLLELGHWWPLRNIAQKQNDRAAMRDYLLRMSVPFLAGAIGEAYARATEACLSGVLEGDSVEEKFSRLVIAPLEELLSHGSRM